MLLLTLSQLGSQSTVHATDERPLSDKLKRNRVNDFIGSNVSDIPASLPMMNVVQYIASYIVRKMSSNHNGCDCIKVLIGRVKQCQAFMLNKHFFK